MLVTQSLKLRKYQVLFAILFPMIGGITISDAYGRNLDADFVLNEMESKQQYAFVQGILLGLAYARFLADKPDETAMTCIQNWLNTDTEQRWRLIRNSFEKFGDKPPAVILHLLTNKECGE
ncbi:hypothetical protein B7H23_01350 [Notoacmeibacter marinus]|uniref:Rap1a immunity protein domain-containing protein n=1 Tax=Notoacmeibacter marinus TaxID=1876515 RepID=A0A231V240_9HYPH|nr:hypothetical protein [Notoacmeibacter marinus]OXT01646.1 hypothetical protein B7H23_01350 [Notoacmeibacter marinus]